MFSSNFQGLRHAGGTGPLTPVFPNIWGFQSRLDGPHHPANGYLLRLGREWWLIDPPADLTPEILKALIGCEKIARILVTHWQAEHVEGILKFPGTRVLVSPGDSVLARGKAYCRGLIQPWPEPWDWETRGNFPGHLAGAANERPLEAEYPVEALLEDGSLCEGIEILATPGQGKNAVTLLLSSPTGIVGFCGDLIYGEGQLWNWFDCDWDYGPETGQRAVRDSARRLAERDLTALLPAHGEIIQQPREALRTLIQRLDRVLSRPPELNLPLNRPDIPSRAEGFRQLAPHVFQYRNGNTVVLTADSGKAVVIDDGLCIWEPMPERRSRHDAVFRNLKEALGITKIEWLIPTHYHGDHIDGMLRLARAEGARIIALESICDPLEGLKEFNIACPLSWYGTGEYNLPVDVKVAEGHQLPWEGTRLEFFHLGGQTWYHQGIQVRLDGFNILVVGDAWWGTSSEPGPVLCWNHAEPETQGWVFALDRMIERAPTLLVCGHGSSIYDPMPMLRQARQKWRARLANFHALNPRQSNVLFFNPS